MYHYPHYRDEDLERLLSVVRAYPLGLLVSATGESFAASHLPFTAEFAAGGSLLLRAHIDNQNPQLPNLDGASVYVVFQGPNTYISPTVYVTRQLPTWNYVAVHVEGRARTETPGVAILDDIERLAQQSEGPDSGWTMDKSEARVRNLAPLVSRVLIDVERIEGRFKLSQEKCLADRTAATTHLGRQLPQEPHQLLEHLSFGRPPVSIGDASVPDAGAHVARPVAIEHPEHAAIIARVTRRIIPFLCLIYFCCFLDRVNVGFAALTMNAELGLTATMFGFGTGIFFIGYILFEIPSNLALRAFGARRWLARIMIAWGLISGATAFAWSPGSFYVIRFLLGVAEAGLLPGVVLYMTYWIPEKNRAQMLGLFMVAIALSGLVGAPLSGILFKLHGALGLSGWQWMFIIESAPTVVLGFVTLVYLTDRPADATWLSPPQRAWLQAHMEEEERGRAREHPWSLAQTFASPRVWSLGLVNFGLLVGLYTINFWMPQVIKEAGVASPVHVGLIAALPALVGAIGMITWSRHSDRSGERTWHLVLAIAVAVIGFASAAAVTNPVAGIALLITASLGVHSALPLFWSLPTRFLSGAGMAGGLALINSISNVGGYVGPQLMGYIKDQTASFAFAFGLIACILVIVALIVIGADAEALRRLGLRTPRNAVPQAVQRPDHA
jgi:ACS family tartrate transporter-like MFS transporter